MVSIDLFLCVKKLYDDSIFPKQATEGSVGYDLYAHEDVKILKGDRRTIGIGVAMKVPNGHYGRISPRSGLAVKYGIQILGGAIDTDFRGEVGVILYYGGNNTDPDYFTVKKGDRIAQLILEKVSTVQVQVVEDLSKTERGDGGFGSTGK